MNGFSEKGQLPISIVIVNWNTRTFLEKCLNSIAEFWGTESLEVIVVDNHSSDHSAELVATQFPWVQLHALPENTGYALGNNIGCSVAKHEYILFLNPDTEFIDRSLGTAVEQLMTRPELGSLGARQIAIDGSTQRSIRGFPTIIGILGDITKIGKIFPNSSFDSYRLTGFNYELEQEAPQPMGTFLIVRKSAMERIGAWPKPFDQDFPIFFNEVDLLFRLKIGGWQCRYNPEVKILHHGGESTKIVRKSMIWESHRSLCRYLSKHPPRGLGKFFLPAIKALVMTGAWLRARAYEPPLRFNDYHL